MNETIWYNKARLKLRTISITIFYSFFSFNYRFFFCYLIVVIIVKKKRRNSIFFNCDTLLFHSIFNHPYNRCWSLLFSFRDLSQLYQYFKSMISSSTSFLFRKKKKIVELTDLEQKNSFKRNLLDLGNNFMNFINSLYLPIST